MENTKITTQTTATPINTVPPVVPPQPVDLGNEKLMKALYYIYDAFDRVNMPWFVVGQTHDAIKGDRDMSGDKIEIGVRKNEWVSGGKRILDAYVTPITETDDEARYEYEGVPIVLKVYEDSACITATDTKMYKHEEFHLPNPYDEFERTYTDGK